MISFDREPICSDCYSPLSPYEWIRAAADGKTPVRCDDCLVEAEVDEATFNLLLVPEL
jgi:hypothetical protein